MISADDFIKIAILLLGGGGPIAYLFREYIKAEKTRCDECCTERDEYRKANDAALAAYRQRDEELNAWRAKQAASGTVSPP